MFKIVEDFIAGFSSWVWDWPLLVLLIGGGMFFLIYSRFTPFFYFKHAIDVLRGKYDNEHAPGQLSHFQALSSAIAATVGMGNISGVAVAIVAGGPGAVFWMWISALIGMATKFYTCSLAVMYRSKDDKGALLSGPMYVIAKGLGGQWKPLAILFALAGLVGTLPAFTANQLTQTLVDVLDWDDDYKWYIGIVLAGFASLVIMGGIKRIGIVASRLVPFMVVLYFITVITILVLQIEKIPDMFMLIFSDAFSGKAAAGGALGYLIKTGVKRAAFSNEAGIGTAPMMHGTAKTNEPIREGLVAMIGPAIDTLLVCTLTALAILSTGVWQSSNDNGISLTLEAFNSVLPYGLGDIVVVIMVLVFGLSTLFSYSHYGTTCLGFLTKPKYGKYYNYLYIVSIIIAAVVKIEFAINLIDSAFAIMAIPTVISGLLLAPRVNARAKIYFEKYKV
ncbi:AGCS family alanine or glycine:cation symporter [Aquimarina sp. EL_43]|uniref:alanine/glycine:cation symporter family protein n=1 Tax=unclassified Aquimarina TaxID=2627091 RepID=UPI0018CB7BF8|nr:MULTISPECIES: amino acid carrier protein [unclassified Aquimarina]MBG6130125.1 AGCS family alanine or glycine:cation symporter [Aquimarina sp. EL_35]MBG6148905.1 AGCS family alanine or glycine:cation symporter [Aquimarina sp. EL_32]MBG6168721.1 AGCS family alanine or glycine:cation symporter [Aquimarina sp. EL_43]